MNILEKIQALFSRKDDLEWDASDPAGDESAYDKDYASEYGYDHSEFEKETDDGN